MNIYTFYTPSHKIFFNQYFKPTASQEFTVNGHLHETQLCPEALYKSEGWRTTQIEKVKHWINCIRTNFGDHIICCDTDIQFLGPIKDKIIDYLGDGDIGFQQNWLGGKICSGFFVCKCCPKTLEFFELTLNKLKILNREDTAGGGEQYVMQEIIEKKFLNLKYIKLKFSEFWCPGIEYEDLSQLTIPEDICMHHANWVHGVDRKLDQLDYVSRFIHNKNPQFYRDIVTNNQTVNIKKNESKIALCLSSLLRNFATASESLIDRVINSLPPKVDFFGHFPSTCDTPQNRIFLEKIQSKCSESKILFEDDPSIPQHLQDYSDNLSSQRHGMLGNLLQWRSMKSCSEMIQAHESKNGKYDWIIWSRPDLYYFNSLDNLSFLDNNKIYIPSHDNHLQGLHDRFCIGNSENMHNRMHIYEYFCTIWYDQFHDKEDRLTWSPYRECFLWNPEVVLRDLLKDELSLEVSGLNLCCGKLRDNYFAMAPFWYEVFGTTRTGFDCSFDSINYRLLNKLNTLPQYKVFKDSSPWFAIHTQDFKSYNNKDIKTELTDETFLHKLLRKVESKKLIANHS